MKRTILVSLVLLALTSSSCTYIQNLLALASSSSQPAALKLYSPASDQTDKVQPDLVGITVLLAGRDRIAYYTANNQATMRLTSLEGLTKIISANKSMLQNGKFVVIKATPKAEYKMLVDCLDKVSLAKIENYTLEDPTEEEQIIIDQLIKR